MLSFDRDGRVSLQWLAALQFTRKLISGARPGSEFGLLFFSGEHVRKSALTKDTNSLLTTLDAFRGYRGDEHAGHKTPLWDAIKQASSMLEPRTPRDALIIITDGEGNSGKETIGSISRVLSESGVRAFPLVFVTTGPITDQERDGLEQLRWLTKDSGGYLTELDLGQLRGQWSAQSDQTLATAAHTILTLADSSYEVTLRRDASRKPERVNFKVPKKNVHLIYPRSVPSCTP